MDFGGFSRLGKFGSAANEKMREYFNSEVSSIIDEIIHSERDRAILKRRFVDGITFERLAEEFDMSPAQIGRIVHRRGDPLFLMLKK